MAEAFIVDGTRTPFGKFGGALSSVRADNLAHPIRALMARHNGLPWAEVDDVIYGCANQAGEDNRNVARMAVLLAGLPIEVPGVTVNRLCASGLEAVAQAARAIKAGEGDFFIAGGVESIMAYGTDSMPETGENVAEDWGVSRADQDAMALRVGVLRKPRRMVDLPRKSRKWKFLSERAIR